MNKEVEEYLKVQRKLVVLEYEKRTTHNKFVVVLWSGGKETIIEPLGGGSSDAN